MTDFERIRDSMLGYLRPAARVAWVQDISREGTDYDAAYQKLLNLRESLCRRLGADDDAELDAILDAAMELEQAVARGMFDAAVDYAARDFQL